MLGSVATAPIDNAVLAAPRAFGSHLLFVLACGGVLLVLLTPVLLTEHPRAVDLPNHLARHYIGATIAGAEALQTYYEHAWRLIPNLAGDALHVPLSRLFSIYDAGRVVLGLSIALWLAAPLVLHRAIWGRFSLWPLFAGLVIYNANLLWGFENYLLATAFSVLLFALWLAWRERMQAARLLLFAGLASGLYLAHVMAFGLLGLLVLGYEAGDLWRHRKDNAEARLRHLAKALVPFLPATLHFFALTASSQAGHGSGTEFGPLSLRIEAFLSPTDQSLGGADTVLCLVVTGVLAFGLLQRRWFRVQPGMVPVLLLLAVLAAVMPMKLMGVYLTHLRLPFILAVLLIAASRWEGPSLLQRQAFAVFVAAMLAMRAFDLTLAWRQHDAEVAEVVAAVQTLNESARLLPVAGGTANPGILHWHSAAFAVIERHAFIPTLFTGAHLLRPTAAFRHLDHPQAPPVSLPLLAAARAGPPEPASRPFWSSWRRDYSHILLFDRQPGANPFPDILEPMARGAVFTLYRNRAFEAAASAPQRPERSGG